MSHRDVCWGLRVLAHSSKGIIKKTAAVASVPVYDTGLWVAVFGSALL
jgi:hypothetical protein